MLAFATELPIDRNRDVADFLHIIEKWILGSPHTQFTAKDLAGLASTVESHVKRGIEGLHAITLSTSGEQAAAIRYTRSAEDLEWTTTAVLSRRALDSWVGIKIFCESRRPAVHLPPAKKPVLVRILLEEMGGRRTDHFASMVAPSASRMSTSISPLA